MSEQSTRACPRCQVLMNSGLYQHIEIDLCPECDGVLVLQRNLNSLLQKMMVELEDEGVDLTEPVETMEDKGAHVPCPQCRREMDNYGYMGMRQVQIDFCMSCNWLWLDTDELATISLLYAQSQMRSDKIQEESTRYAKQLAERSSRRLIAAALAARVGRGFV